MLAIPESDPPYGRLDLIIGPMFSGKTTELFRRLKRYVIAKKKVGFVSMKSRAAAESMMKTHGAETLCGDKMVFFEFIFDANKICYDYSRDFRIKFNRETICGVDRQGEFYINAFDVDVVAFDEAQFFREYLKDLCESLIEAGKIVIVSGLNGTFKRDPWPTISALIPLANEITKLSAVCSVCTKDADYSKKVEGNPLELIEMAGEAAETSVKYEPRCAQCYDLDCYDLDFVSYCKQLKHHREDAK
jgi:thymidine kinase